MYLFSQVALIFVLSCIISPLVFRALFVVLRKYNIMDRPHLYRSEKWRNPVPYSIGLGLFVIFTIFLPLLSFGFDISPILEKRLWIVFTVGWILTVITLIDDLDTIGKSRWKVSPFLRLLLQLAVGTIIGLTSIKISYISNIFWGVIHLSEWRTTFFSIEIFPLALIITAFWYALVFNAINFSDGIPWLTAGYALISFLILSGLAIKLVLTDHSDAAIENSRFLLLLLAMVIPATFVLMRFDSMRKWVMGDTGTIFLAFLLATFAIIGGGKIATVVSVLWVYLIDLIFVVTTRIIKGKNPFHWDQTHHLHFRLLELGFHQSEIRMIIYTLTAFFGLAAIFLDTRGKIFLILFIAVVTVFLTKILSLRKK